MKKTNQPKLISNRRARHDYTLSNSLVVGIALTGAETKALSMGHGQLRGAYVNVSNDELWLVNATISPTNGIPISEEDQTRNRKLLAKKNEIKHLIDTKKQGRTIVPLEVLTQGRYIKLRIAVGQGKKNYDKRQGLKEKDESRQVNRALRPRS